MTTSRDKNAVASVDAFCRARMQLRWLVIKQRLFLFALRFTIAEKLCNHCKLAVIKINKNIITKRAGNAG
jgi:hypothetical protein